MFICLRQRSFIHSLTSTNICTMLSIVQTPRHRVGIRQSWPLMRVMVQGKNCYKIKENLLKAGREGKILPLKYSVSCYTLFLLNWQEPQSLIYTIMVINVSILNLLSFFFQVQFHEENIVLKQQSTTICHLFFTQ